MVKIQRAIISVFNKEGILPFARFLARQGVQIISTGGTASLLEKEGIPVTPIDEITGFPEVMDGRVKTLHPKVHGGILGIRDSKRHREQMTENAIEPIDMVVVNLYPFEKVTEAKNVPLDVAIENIDIGGPAMLRSAAKNFRFVAPVCDVSDYDRLTREMEANNGALSEKTRFYLAGKVFFLTSRYDHAIDSFLKERRGEADEILPERLHLEFERVSPLRYGENPHQKAGFYRARQSPSSQPFTQLHGKELSYNNILDFYACLEILREFSAPAVCVVKHNNPCGICESMDIKKAITGAIDSDPVSAFGGIVGINRPCGESEVAHLFSRLSFIEVIIAPGFTRGALKLLKSKKNLRVLKVRRLQLRPAQKKSRTFVYQDGFMLVQEGDRSVLVSEKKLRKAMRVVTRKKITEKDREELLFAWKCAKVVKSNAIVITKSRQTVGIGAGQMSRVGAMAIACQQAGKKARGAYVASDGFFPMADNIEVAVRFGIRAVIQPGGSIKDGEVIAMANQKKIAMVFTGSRHFKH